MRWFLFSGLLLANIINVFLQTTQSNDCCLKRTVKGQSGEYNLVSSNNPDCPGGCAYELSGQSQTFCFRYSHGSVATCAATGTKKYPKVATEAITMTTTPPTTTTIQPTTSTTTTPIPTTTIDCEKIWLLQNFTDPPTYIVQPKALWGPDEFCPKLSYAVGFELKIAPICIKRCKSDDDVALMGIRLHCAYPGSFAVIGTITSSVTQDSSLVSRHRDRRDGKPLWPYWTSMKSCPQGQFLKSSRYNSEPYNKEIVIGDGEINFTCPPGVICSLIPPAVDDPSGGQNVDMECTDGTNLPGEGINTNEDANWSPWKSCEEGMAVCGIRSELYNGDNDYIHNLGQTRVRFHCCKICGN